MQRSSAHVWEKVAPPFHQLYLCCMCERTGHALISVFTTRVNSFQTHFVPRTRSCRMDRFNPGVTCYYILTGESDEEQREEELVWGGQPNQVGRCDLWRDPQNVHKGAISRHERCSTLISADSMLHIKVEGKSSYFPPKKCFDVSIRGVFDILWRSH